MTSPTLITVEAYQLDDLTPSARDRLVEREREAAWGSWVTDEVTAVLTSYLRDRLDGVDGVEVTAWGIDYGAGAVVEGDVVDPRALARALGLPEDDRPLRLDPHHGRGGSWAGTTYVLVGDPDGYGWSRDDAASEALGDLIGEALDEARAWADGVTGDAAILDGLREAGWWYDRRGHYLPDVVTYPEPDDLPAWGDVGTWSGVLDVLAHGHRAYADRDVDPVAAADRLRTLGRMLDHAATEVRDRELDRARLAGREVRP